MKKKEILFDILLKVSESRMDIETAEERILQLFDVTNSVCPHPHQKWEGNPLKICQVCGEDRTKHTGLVTSR